MFGRLFDQMVEPFVTPSDTAESKKIKSYFSDTLPNIIYNNDPNINAARLTEVSNTRIASN